jgi:hypothetical protein
VTIVDNQGNSTGNPTTANRNRLTAGAVLIVVGLLAFVLQFVQSDILGLLFLPALGLIFLTWGAVSRNIGPLIPGGILFGIGLGAFIVNRIPGQVSDESEGGIFLLSFALGWALITILYLLVSGKFVFWPLIPGGIRILALIGAALLAGSAGLEVLTWIGRGWPLILIVLGLYLLLWRRTKKIPSPF